MQALGEIDYSEITEVIDSLGIANYTFRITNHPADDYKTFHNLVLTSKDSELEVHLVKYVMTESLAQDVQQNGKMNYFEGTVQATDLSKGLDPGEGGGGNPGNNCPPISTGGNGGGTGDPNPSDGDPPEGDWEGGCGSYLDVSYACICGRTFESWDEVMSNTTGCNTAAYPVITRVVWKTIVCRQSKGRDLSPCAVEGTFAVNQTTNNPCEKAKPLANAVTAIRKDYIVSPKLNALANHATNSNVEYAVTISSNNGWLDATDPYTNNKPGEVTIVAPTTGDFVGGAHSHPPGGAVPPSPADFYGTMQTAKYYNSYIMNYVFSHNGTEYAFMVNNRQQAENFLNTYPYDSNVTNGGKAFTETSEVGVKFNEIYNCFNEGRCPNYSVSDQNDGLETAMAYILEKYSSGISLAKKDANGNFKGLNVKTFPYTVPNSGGKVITAYKTELCP